MNKKRPLITAGMLILLGETAYLTVWKNLIISVIIIMTAVLIFAKDIFTGNSTGKKKCSYLLLFCCFAAGLAIGAVSDIEDRNSQKLIGENIRIEGKVTDVRDGEKSLRITVKAGVRSVVIYVKAGRSAKDGDGAIGTDGFVYVENNGGYEAGAKDGDGLKERGVWNGDDEIAEEDTQDRVRPGEYIVAEGVIEAPEGSTNPGSFDMADYYSGKKILGVMYVDHINVQNKKDYIIYALGYLRESLEKSLYIYFDNARASFLSAMLLGDKSGLDRNQKLMYQKNGLAHILAISGMHVSIIALAFEKLLEMLGVGRKFRCALVMILVILYGLMTGFAPPIVRAIIMLLLRYAAFFVKRSSDVPTDIMLAILIMAIVNPQSVFTAGLQLSFAAAAAMYISDRIYINYFGWRSRIYLKERYGDSNISRSTMSAFRSRMRTFRSRMSEFRSRMRTSRSAMSLRQRILSLPRSILSQPGSILSIPQRIVSFPQRIFNLLLSTLCLRQSSLSMQEQRLNDHAEENQTDNLDEMPLVRMVRNTRRKKAKNQMPDMKMHKGEGIRKIIHNAKNNPIMRRIHKRFDRFKKKSLMDKKTFRKRIKEGIGRIIISTLVMNIILTPLLIYYYYEIYPYSMILGIVIIVTVSYVIAGGFVTAILGLICMLISAGFGMDIHVFAVFLFNVADFVARASAWLVNIMLSLYEKICVLGFKLPFSGLNTGHTSIWMCGIYYILIALLVTIVLWNPRGKERGYRREKKSEDARGNRREDEGRYSRENGNEDTILSLRLKRIGIRRLRLYLGMAYSLCVIFLILTGLINRNNDRVVILDVGQGSSAIVHFRDGRNYILDGGSTSKDSVGEYAIIPALKYYGMSDITGIFVSHTDEDHINGLIELSQLKGPYRLRVGAIYMAAGTKKDANYMELEESAGISITGLSEGDVVDGSFRIVYPDVDSDERVADDGVAADVGVDERATDDRVNDEEIADDRIVAEGIADEGITDDGVVAEGIADNRVNDEEIVDDRNTDDGVVAEGIADEGSETEKSGNDYSLVVMLESIFNGREFRILFPGDIGSEIEKQIVEAGKMQGKDISADVLIAPHHGSKYSSSSTFLEEVSCEIAVISCGKNNIYGHPSPETLERLEKVGCRIIRTDKYGAVIIE